MQRDTYTRVVSTLKIVLPMIALGLLGTVFLITADDGFDTGFSFTQADFDALEEGNGLTNPRINAKTSRGDTFTLTAERISPQSGDVKVLIASNLSANLMSEQGRGAEVVAEVALLDLTKNVLVLSLGGNLVTSDGYDASVESLAVNIDTGTISGDRIEAAGPLGDISADNFRITIDDDENQVLWFEKNVRVTISTVGQTE